MITMPNYSDSALISLELPGFVFIFGSFDSQSLFVIDEKQFVRFNYIVIWYYRTMSKLS